MRGREWQHYAAPAAFLLAATIAILLVRSGLESGSKNAHQGVSLPTPSRRHVVTTLPSTTTTKKKRKPATERFWSVQAGDTFAVIASKSGVSVAALQHLNPTVKSTSLFIGEKIRLR